MFNSSIYGMPSPTTGIGTGIVQTVFGRTGANIYAQSGDYTAAQVGADPAGTANTLFLNHINALDPHTQYVLKADLESYIDSAIAYFDNNINLA